MEITGRNHLTDVISPLANVFGAAKFLTKAKAEDSAVHMVSAGFGQMLNGLKMLMDGTEQILNDKINQILDEEKSILSDEDIEGFAQLEELINLMRPFILDSDSGIPDDFRRSVARVVERGEILANLERQFRPQEAAIEDELNLNALRTESNEKKESKVGGWTEV